MPTPVVVELRQDSEAGQDAKGLGKRRLRGKPWTALEDQLLARLAAAAEGDWSVRTNKCAQAPACRQP